MKDGKGKFNYKKHESADSIVKGYWKNDVYAGLWLRPYELRKSFAGFTRLEVKPDVGVNNTLTIVSQNVIKSNSLMSNMPPGLPVISNFNVDTGTYEQEEGSTTDKI